MLIHASDEAIAGILFQKDNEGPERVIACVSHKLTEGEKRWTVREKEAFAIVWSITNLRFYLAALQSPKSGNWVRKLHIFWLFVVPTPCPKIPDCWYTRQKQICCHARSFRRF
jgi:hypothetical protein